MGRGPGAGAGWEAIYKFVTERAGSLNIKDYYEVKKKNKNQVSSCCRGRTFQNPSTTPRELENSGLLRWSAQRS